MTIRKITTDAIDPGSITENLLHINVSNKVNAAYNTANTANSAGSGGYDQANAAYGKANAAATIAENAYGQANTARSDANTTFATVNTTFGTINTSLSTINSSFSTTNTNYQAAYAQANTARDTANNAYNNSNTKLSTSGGSISGDLSITGNLTVTGNATTINVTNLSVNDSMILLSTNAVGDSNDIGFIGHFDRGATATHAGLIRKATQNQFYLFDNYEVEPTNNVIDVAGNNFRVGNLRLGIINANSYVTASGLDVTGQANAAYAQANAAYGQANAARSDANTTFATVNTTFATINTTSATMNTATSNRVLKAGDTMTGQLNISSGGLLVTGNVGIGTASPEAQLHIVKSSSGALGPQLVLDNTAGSTLNNAVEISFLTDGGASPTGTRNARLRAVNESAGDGATRLEFYTWNGGTDAERMRISSNGNVGINVTNPYSRLTITPASVSWGEGITINPAPNGFSAVYFRTEAATNDSVTNTWAIGKNSSGQTGGELLHVVRNGLTGSALHRADAVQSWQTNGNACFGFNVGIGLTSPGQKLDVGARVKFRSDGSSSAGMWLTDSSGNENVFMGLQGASSTDSWGVWSNSGWRLTLLNGGNFGVGTTGPATKLHVSGSTRIDHSVGNSSLEDGNGLQINGAYTNGQYSHRLRKWDDSGGVPLYVQFTSGTANTWANIAKFGPNTADDAYLTVYGKMSVTGTASLRNGIQFFRVNSASTGLSFYNSTYSAWCIYMAATGVTSCGPHGNFTSPGSGHGVTSWALRSFIENSSGYGFTWETGTATGNPTVIAGLEASSGNFSIAGTLTESSSITLKENINPIINALNAIMNINGYTYDRIDGSAKQRAGLIAEEIHDILPNVVQKDENGKPSGINYTNLIAYLIESIKELKVEIDSLKNK